MGNVIPFGFQAELRYIEETTPGTTPANPALLLLSRETVRAQVWMDKNVQESLDIGNIEVDSYFSAQNTYGAEIEAHVYDVDRVMDFAERVSTGGPRSFTLELIPDIDATTKHYIRGTGWRAQTVTLNGQVGEAWVVTIVLTGGTWTNPVTSDPGIGTGSREAVSAITDALRTFAGGVITIDGTAAAILVEEFEVVFDHGTEAHHTAGSIEPVAAAVSYGPRKITGTLNMSLDDGFKEHFDRVDAFADATIVLPFSTTGGQPKLTFTGVKFPRFEGEVSVEADIVMGAQPWVATTYAEGTV